MYIHRDALSINRIVEELYDFSKPGGVGIADALTERAKRELRAGMEEGRRLMTGVERCKGEVTQEMETAYLERIGNRIYEAPSLALAVFQLKAEFDGIHELIARAAGFSGLPNSVGLHRYAKGSIGITPHQDYKRDINLIASFVIDGYAPFFVATDRQKTNELELPSTPGSIIFMRAARTEAEQSARPFHYLVGPMQQDRYSVLIRTRETTVDGY